MLTIIVPMVIGLSTIFISAFLASFVEAVEALTIVLTAGSSRGWKPALLGMGSALLLLTILTAISFALAVVLTPLVIAKELLRLIKAHPEITHAAQLAKVSMPGLLGMVCSFGSGLLALWLLSRWLEQGRWKFFGYYCLTAAITVSFLAHFGF